MRPTCRLLLAAAFCAVPGTVLAAEDSGPGLGLILRMVPLAPEHVRLRSLRLGGSIAQNFEVQRSTDSEWRGSSHTSLDVRLNGSGFYWQPWFSRISADLGASVQVRKPLLGAAGEAMPTGSDRAGFEAVLFPVSPFPLTMSLSVSESHDGYIPLRQVTRSTVSTRIAQEFRPTGGRRNRYRLAYGYTGWGQHRGGREISAVATHSASGAAEIDLGKWRRLDLSGNFVRTESSPGGSVRQTIVGTARHQFTPLQDLNVSSTASLSDNWFYDPEPESETRVDVALLTSSATWSPGGKPYRGSASVRLGATRSDVNGQLTENLSSDLSAGGSYDLYRSRSTSVIVSAAVSRSASGGVANWRFSSRQGINWRHSLPGGTWQGYRYHAGFSAGANSSVNQDGFNRPEGSAGSNQGLSRRWQGQFGGAQWTLSQSGSTRQSATTSGGYDASLSLSHSATLNWGWARSRRSDSVTFSASDSRGYTLLSDDARRGLGSSQQRLDLQYSHREGWGINGEFVAGYRLRGARSATGEQDGAFGYSAEISASYEAKALFGTPRLDYRTKLRLTSPDAFPWGLGDGVEQLNWNHSLSYNIGRLRSSLSAGVHRSQGHYDFTASLQLERSFGR